MNVIENLLSFFLLLECCTIIYFFFFLESHFINNFYLLKTKNQILIFLWSSFFTSLCVGISTFLISQKFHTLNLYELDFFSTPTIYGLILLLGLFTKIGMPGFHYFKLEVYKYLPVSTLFIFSLLTLILNILFTIFLISWPWINSILIQYNFIIYSIVCAIFFIIINFKVYNVNSLLALSSFLTLTTNILLFV